MSHSQVVSKQRVTDHGEVYTSEREVAAMIDLVSHEAERIESRFLEPACGNGNFLRAILARKLDVVERRYAASQLEFERYAVLAVSSVYGIDILEDNVAACRVRLLALFDEQYYTRLFPETRKPRCLEAVRFILGCNIVHGDALTLQTVGAKPEGIIFSEWSPLNGSLLKRRDFTFRALMSQGAIGDLPLFSDLGEEAYLPTPLREYPPVHFLELAHVR